MEMASVTAKTKTLTPTLTTTHWQQQGQHARDVPRGGGGGGNVGGGQGSTMATVEEVATAAAEEVTMLGWVAGAKSVFIFTYRKRRGIKTS
jgi:hypothetical protein